MAFTVSSIVNGVPGNTRIANFVITPDTITGVVTVPGAVSVDAILAFGPKSCAVAVGSINVGMNVNASGVAAAGVIGFSNVVTTSAHTYFLTVLYH